jgi:hypothetical protein
MGTPMSTAVFSRYTATCTAPEARFLKGAEGQIVLFRGEWWRLHVDEDFRTVTLTPREADKGLVTCLSVSRLIGWLDFGPVVVD